PQPLACLSARRRVEEVGGRAAADDLGVAAVGAPDHVGIAAVEHDDGACPPRVAVVGGADRGQQQARASALRPYRHLVGCAGAGGTGTDTSHLVEQMLRAAPELRLTIFASREAPSDFRRADWAGDVDWVDFPKGIMSRWNTVEVLAGIPPLALRRRLELIHSPA